MVNYQNKMALSSVQKLHHQGFDEQILQLIPLDPVTFVSITIHENLKTRNFCFPEIDGASKSDNVLQYRERGLRRQTGGGGRMPSAPKPALIFPPMLIRSKKGRSLSFAGTGLSFPSHNTNRGASGSPRTRSSFKPLSTCHNIRINK